MSQVLVLRTIVVDSTIGAEVSAALEAAASKLANEIKDDREGLISFALAAFHPRLPEDAEQLPRAEELLYEANVSIASLHKDRPITLIRATMVLALYELLADPVLAALLYLTLADYFHFVSDKNEAPLREDFLAQAKEGYLAHATATWKQPPEATGTKKTALVKATLNAEVKTNFQKALEAAVNNGELITASYPLHDPWAALFVPRVADAVVAAMSATLEASNKTFAGVLTSIERKANEVQATDRQAEFLKRQGKILWWLQVKYSEEISASYRDLQITSGAVQMALDYLTLVSAPVPPHVEAVLSEAMRSTYAEATSEVELLASLKAVPSVNNASYPPLTLGAEMGTRDSARVFERRTGLSAKTKLTPAEFARWMFRHAQARAMV